MFCSKATMEQAKSRHLSNDQQLPLDQSPSGPKTFMQRRFTFHRRWFDVGSTSCARWGALNPTSESTVLDWPYSLLAARASMLNNPNFVIDRYTDYVLRRHLSDVAQLEKQLTIETKMRTTSSVLWVIKLVVYSSPEMTPHFMSTEHNIYFNPVL